MDAEELSLKAHSLLRRAGLAELPRPVLVGTFIIALALVLVGIWHFWPKANADFVATNASPPQEASGSAASESAMTQASIVVDVEGAVNAPGLYTLPADARVGEAIQAAGGLAANALPGAANLAQKLADGEQVTIPTIEQAQDGEQPNTSSSKTGSSTKKEAKININTAGAEELQELSGVGPALSERIIAYREANGRFARIEDLQNVSGIGETRFANLKDKICV